MKITYLVIRQPRRSVGRNGCGSQTIRDSMTYIG
jgi:hypothetical protein